MQGKVSFYSCGPLLSTQEFIYRAFEEEDLKMFTERIHKKFPTAQIVSPDEPQAPNTYQPDGDKAGLVLLLENV